MLETPLITRHIDYALVAKSHTPMYLMHKYWARKPHNVVAEYIKHYSREGEIVLDPFAGSGVTAIEALKLGRKAVAVDLGPMAIFITRMTGMPLDLDKAAAAFNQIKDGCAEQIKELYKTKCGKCNNEAIILATVWKRDEAGPVEIRYYCENCKARNVKDVDKNDLALLKEIEQREIPYWYPKKRLYYNSNPFIKKEKTETIPDLFTKRNLLALSILFNEIDRITDKKIKEVFRFSFTSLSHLASKLTPVRPTRPFSSFWAMHSYWIPPINMESNVWMLFESAVLAKQGIIKGKTESNKEIKKFREAKKFEDLSDKANIFIKTYNALELKEIIPPNSVDYVFTDPPYGGAVQYFELSTLWASWLGMELNYNEEITVNQQQNKSFDYYHRLLAAAFRQIYNVLKPGRYMTVTFHSTNIKVWTSIISAVVLAGFDLEKIIYQPPARPSAKGLLQPYGSAVGDYYIRFKKPTRKKVKGSNDASEERYKRIIIESAKKILAMRGEPTSYTHILNGIFVELEKEGALLGGKINPDKVMEEQVGGLFVLVDTADGKGKKWWFKEPHIIQYLDRFPLTDRLEKAIVNVLNREIKVAFDEVLQEIFINFPNALTPDTQSIREILTEYAHKTSDGKWMLKPLLRNSESIHDKMIILMAEIGKKAGYDIWIGENEQGHTYNGRRLSEWCTNLRPVFRFIPTQNLDRVRQIDVLWHDGGRLKYAFEIEHTTAITEAIVRGSNIPDEKVKKFIIIPDARESFLFRKLEQPILKESVAQSNWRFIFYKKLTEFYGETKMKKTVSLEEFESISRMPKKVEKPEQLNLNLTEGDL